MQEVVGSIPIASTPETPWAAYDETQHVLRLLLEWLRIAMLAESLGGCPAGVEFVEAPVRLLGRVAGVDPGHAVVDVAQFGDLDGLGLRGTLEMRVDRRRELLEQAVHDNLLLGREVATRACR